MLIASKLRPTKVAELVPLLASAKGHHDALGAGAGAGEVWFAVKHLTPIAGCRKNSVLWGLKWPHHIIDELSRKKPKQFHIQLEFGIGQMPARPQGYCAVLSHSREDTVEQDRQPEHTIMVAQE